MAADTALWTPTQDQIDAAPMTAFMKAAAAKTGTAFSSYAELHRWSIDEREAFWGLAWDFCGVVGDKGERVLVDGDR
ncbi:MAG: acetoacetate--CoA ligase, partial [Mesorhizobium sp.]